mgnify:CR=1 FL=1
MVKIDIISGFLGAGKTTLIKKLIEEGFKGEKLVLIENEFGEIGIDGGFLKDAGVQITEMNSGCICCSLVGDFGTALKKVITEYAPDRIIIEPSGVGKLSDVIKAVKDVAEEVEVQLDSYTTVADVSKCKIYMKNFGEFFNNQIESANTIVLSRTQTASQDKIEKAVAMIREHNAEATIITTPWDDIDGSKIKEAMQNHKSVKDALFEDEDEHEHHHHHDHDEDHDHEHHHEHDENCTCGCHDHDHDHHHHHHHHHGHDADEVFISWGEETHKKFTKAEIERILKALGDTDAYGIVLRAKGYVANAEGEKWIHFDYVPGEPDIRDGGAMVTGRICVIGSKLNEEAVAKLFGVEKQ